MAKGIIYASSILRRNHHLEQFILLNLSAAETINLHHQLCHQTSANTFITIN